MKKISVENKEILAVSKSPSKVHKVELQPKEKINKSLHDARSFKGEEGTATQINIYPPSTEVAGK